MVTPLEPWNIALPASDPSSPDVPEINHALFEVWVALKRYKSTGSTSSVAKTPLDAQIDKSCGELFELLEAVVQDGDESAHYQNPPIVIDDENDQTNTVPQLQVVTTGPPSPVLDPLTETQLLQANDIVKVEGKHYIDGIPEFVKELMKAGTRDQLHKPRYKNVAMLVLTWEDNDLLEVVGEVEQFMDLFRSKFHFHVEEFAIPSKKNATKIVEQEITRFKVDFDEDTLMIIYYNGHGIIKENKSFWYPTAAQAKDKTKINVSWNSLQSALLLDEDLDVLIILDCCFAGAAMPRNKGPGPVKEIIAACDKDSKTPEGYFSLTSRLVRIAKKLLKDDPVKGFPVNRLYEKLVGAPPGVAQPMWAAFNADSGSIRLAPLSASESSERVDTTLPGDFVLVRPPNSTPSDSGYGSVMTGPSDSTLPEAMYAVLIVRLKETLDHIGAENWKDCLQKLPKEDVDYLHAVKILNDIDLAAAFPSNSTLCIISIPVHLYVLLPPNPAFTFVSYVRSPNLVGRKELYTGAETTGVETSSEQVQTEPIPTTWDKKAGNTPDEDLRHWLEAMKKHYMEMNGASSASKPGVLVSTCHHLFSKLHIPSRLLTDPDYLLMQEIVAHTRLLVSDKGLSQQSTYEYRLKLELDKIIAPMKSKLQQHHQQQQQKSDSAVALAPDEDVGDLEELEEKFVAAAKYQAEVEVVKKCVHENGVEKRRMSLKPLFKDKEKETKAGVKTAEKEVTIPSSEPEATMGSRTSSKNSKASKTSKTSNASAVGLVKRDDETSSSLPGMGVIRRMSNLRSGSPRRASVTPTPSSGIMGSPLKISS